MSTRRKLSHAGSVTLLTLPLILSSCAGRDLEGKVGGIQTRLQDAIADGSKTIGCAPKETALAEANIKFAEEALRMGEYYRGKEHVILAGKYTEIAELKTEAIRCRVTDEPPPIPPPGENDRDGDGYDDKADSCPDDPEDFDAFEDEDGCPDKDNDGDGVLDAVEYDPSTRTWSNSDQKDGVDCRNDPEDPDGFEDEDGCPDPDNDKDGILDDVDSCPNDPEDLDQFQDEDGCPDDDNDGDGFKDAVDACPNDAEDFDQDQDDDGCPEIAQVDPCEIKVKGKIMFDFGKHDIDSEKFGDTNRKLLDDVAGALNQNPDITIEIGGHTDSKGSNKSNQKLSERRVKSVREYLVGKGIDGSRITFKGYGEDVPVDTNRTAEGRENNRRVEFKRTDNPECNN